VKCGGCINSVSTVLLIKFESLNNYSKSFKENKTSQC